MIDINFKNISIESIDLPVGGKRKLSVSVLRADLLHPIISGNKWFKLRFYIEQAKTFSAIATFGGAYSNHMVATAAACNMYGLKGICIVRGEEPSVYSPSLLQAKALGMQLIFVSRKDFEDKEVIKQAYRSKNWFWINEGGYGIEGANGASTLHDYINPHNTHIICATGTGTTFAGLIKKALPHQTVIGINVLKGNTSIIDEINNLLTKEEQLKKYSMLHEYHFGGYAKHPKELIDFMNLFWKATSIPSDIVYTGKLFYAVNHLVAQDFFTEHSKLIVIHSGGLQGNYSLPNGILHF